MDTPSAPESPSSGTGPATVVVGRVGRAHGVRGDVSVEVRTDEPARRFAEGSVLDTDRGALTVVSAREHSGRMLVHFEGVDDRSGAEQLRGVLLQVTVDLSERPDDADEYYDHQLVGAPVVTIHGDSLGVLTEVVHLPGQDIISVHSPDGRDVLIPFVAAIVTEVDLEGRGVVVDPPEGLLQPDRGD